MTYKDRAFFSSIATNHSSNNREQPADVSERGTNNSKGEASLKQQLRFSVTSNWTQFGIFIGKEHAYDCVYKHLNGHRLLLGSAPQKSQRESFPPYAAVISALESWEQQSSGYMSKADWDSYAQAHPDFQFINLPMEDFGSNGLTHEQADKLTMQIAERLGSNSGDVLVHCKAGRGRSWILVMCYLISIKDDPGATSQAGFAGNFLSL